MTEIAATTIDNLRATTTATLTTQLFRRGFRNVFLQGVRPLKRYEANLVGPAFTLRYIPAREDLDAYGANPDPNALQREAIEAVPPGHVLVMDCRGEARVASAGDIYMTRLRAKGVAGVVSDGGIRDTAAIEKLELPVYCAVPSAPLRPTGFCTTRWTTIARSVAAAWRCIPATSSLAMRTVS
jgi:regulator of RNase E activity RraA